MSTQAATDTKSSTTASNPVKSASALHQLLSPDGYYTYLNIPCPHLTNPNVTSQTTGAKDATAETVDTDLVKKNYRRLSLKHHPDRRGGDPETFRVLNRAKKVLTTPKLRKQYDLLGLDLVDEEENQTNDDDEQSSSSSNNEAGNDEDNENSGSPDSVISQLASVTLASILQVAVRTGLMAIVATFITRFKVTVIPMVLFLAFVTYRVKKTTGTAPREYIVPPLLILGMFAMHYGRATIPPVSDSDTATTTTSTWLYFFGETLTINMFLLASLPPQMKLSGAALNVITITFSVIIALILKGRFWRYAFVIGIELVLALITVLIFPIMEMILEEIMNEKLRKVGEKVRAHSKRLESEIQKSNSKS